MSEYTKEEIDEAKAIADIFMAWFNKNPFEPIGIETPMVSERFQYGGCPDMITDDAIIDIKTGYVSPRNYYELCMQLSAYDQLNGENNNHHVKFGRIIKVDTSGVKVVEFDEIQLDHTFLDYLNILTVYKSRNRFNNNIRALNKKAKGGA